MSGGIDSSVSALLLKAAGCRVQGVWMRNWNSEDDDDGSETCDLTEFHDAAHVADALGIPLERVDFSIQYWHRVWDPSVQQYASGKTPNPDVLCNSEIKFGAFSSFVREKWGQDVNVAMGHYARTALDATSARNSLYRAFDHTKDQSYFLSRVSGQELAKACFPVGGLLKSRVREIAQAVKGFEKVARKQESYGVCFIGKRRKFGQFLSQYVEPTPGYVIHASTGQFLGPVPLEHGGLVGHTVGQRLKLGGLDAKLFVVAKASDRIYVSEKKEHNPFLNRSRVEANSFSWIHQSDQVLNTWFPARCQVRYRSKALPCHAYVEPTGRLRVKLDEVDVTEGEAAPGQVAALFTPDDQRCLGSGFIDEGGMQNLLHRLPKRTIPAVLPPLSALSTAATDPAKRQSYRISKFDTSERRSDSSTRSRQHHQVHSLGRRQPTASSISPERPDGFGKSRAPAASVSCGAYSLNKQRSITIK